MTKQIRTSVGLATLAAALIISSSASANPFQMFPFAQPQAQPSPSQAMAYAPTATATEEATEVSPRFRRQMVNYPTHEAPGTIIVDTPNTYLYFVLGNGRA